MSNSTGLPFNPSGYITSLGTLTLGDKYTDKRGRQWRLMQLDDTLTGDTTAANDLMYWLAPMTAVNTRSRATGGSQNYAVAAGVIDAAIAESSASETKYVLVLCDGRHTVNTSGADDIVAGDYLIHSGNGTVARLAQNDTTAQTADLLPRHVGRALADDNNDANTVDAYIHCDLGIA